MSLDLLLHLLLRRRRKHLLLVAASGISFYAAYKLYHHPPSISIIIKRNKLIRLFQTVNSVVDAVSSTADTVNLLSTDLNRFLRSNSDQVPNSLKQISKLTKSDDFSGSISRLSEALVIGIVKGLGSKSGSASESQTGFTDKLLDKLFSNAAGSGIVSVVVGSFAKNLVLGFYSSGESSSPSSSSKSSSSSGSKWIELICDDHQCRDLIADCIRIFVSNAVAVYLDKTMDVNTYDDFFSGLTNPKHQVKAKDFLVSVCNGAVETLVKAWHQVLTSSNQNQQDNVVVPPHKGNGAASSAAAAASDERIKEIGKWVNQVSSTLAVPSNRRLVLDVTGRVTFETVKSFLEFAMWKISDCLKQSAGFVREGVFQRGFEMVRHLNARSMLIATICFALCLHVMTGMRVLMPA